jgi:hypothetical protein
MGRGLHQLTETGVTRRSFEHLSFTFPSEITSNKDIAKIIKEEQVVGLFGISQAGKTWTLKKEIERARHEGRTVIVIDETGDYDGLATKVISIDEAGEYLIDDKTEKEFPKSLEGIVLLNTQDRSTSQQQQKIDRFLQELLHSQEDFMLIFDECQDFLPDPLIQKLLALAKRPTCPQIRVAGWSPGRLLARQMGRKLFASLDVLFLFRQHKEEYTRLKRHLALEDGIEETMDWLDTGQAYCLLPKAT